MDGPADRERGAAPRKAPDALIFALIIGCVWLGWQVVRHSYAQVAPPLQAVRLNPDSPSALSRAAAEALAAGRTDYAGRLAARSLAIQPFNVRALRVAGQVAETEGSVERADQMITLAGNWSLRDDPAHSWLVKRRLEQRDILSAMAHADALLRRRSDLHQTYFDLLTRAARSDLSAQGALIELVRREPPWRGAYLSALVRDPESLPIAVGLAAALKDGDGGFTPEETARVYSAIAGVNQPELLRRLRLELEGPGAPALTNGGFDEALSASPFSWRLRSGPGVLVEVERHSQGDQPALHALVSDLNQRVLAEQLLLLPPGRWRLSGRMFVSEGPLQNRYVWRILCAPAQGRHAAELALGTRSARTWGRQRLDFVVPATGCGSQWLRLIATAQNQRSASEVWFDDVALTTLR